MGLLWIPFAGAYPKSSSLLNEKISIGLTHHIFKYTEPGLMTETGELNGLSIDYEKDYSNGHSFFTVHGDWSVGKLKYKGFFMTPDTEKLIPRTSSTNDSLFHLSGSFHLKFGTKTNSYWNVSGGIATRLWRDRIKGLGGYRRETRYIYAPVGIGYRVKMSDQHEIQLQGKYHIFLGGKNKTYFSDTQSGLPDIQFQQNSGEGFELSAKSLYQWDKEKTWGVELSYKQWDIARSSLETVDKYFFFEPANNNQTYTIMGFFSF